MLNQIIPGLIGLVGAILGASVSWKVANKQISIHEKPILTLSFFSLAPGCPLKIYLKNIGGTALDVEWKFSGSVAANQQTWAEGKFSAIERNQAFFLFEMEKEAKEDTDLPYKLYTGEIKLEFKGIFGKKFTKVLNTDIYNQLPLEPVTMTEYTNWAKDWKSKKGLFKKTECTKNNFT